MTTEEAFAVLTREFPRRSISVNVTLFRTCTSQVTTDRGGYWVSVVPSVANQVIFNGESLAEAVEAALLANEPATVELPVVQMVGT